MLCFPNCKINLGLHILGKREDGFHNLETVFYPLQIRDALEIISAPESAAVTFSQSGLTVQGSDADNICVKAYQLLQKDFPQVTGIKMHLHKAIPMGAGLGGGSADGAFTLQLLNTKFSLDLSQQQLVDYALQLGSDCPFFIINKPCYATGRGENLEPLQTDLSGYKIAVINPGIHVNTGWAFQQLRTNPSTANRQDLKAAVQQPISSWKALLQNDFEAPVFTAHPEIKFIKDALYQMGARYASMSGSGSTVFGIFDATPSLQQFEEKGWFVKLV